MDNDISNPLFKDYTINGNQVYKQMIHQCIKYLMEKPIVASDLPSAAEVTLRKQGRNYVLHLLCYMPQRKSKTIDIVENKIPLYNQRIKVRLDQEVKRVLLVPQEKEIHFTTDKEYIVFDVPEIDGHQMVFIEV